MNPKFDRLKTLLRELFQLDQADLDFGIYRIMREKSDEVTNFLDNDLLPQVKTTVESFNNLSPTELQNIEGEIYDHIFRFFSRYYSEGDFLSKRVYKEGVYSIPYEGEEVKLHWANSDQYYIKTSEHLRDYSFLLEVEGTQKRVHFKIVDAEEGEHGNIKTQEGKERVFILPEKNCIDLQNDELIISFEYRAPTVEDWPENEREKTKKDGKKSKKTKGPSQKELIKIAVERILSQKKKRTIPLVRCFLEEIH